MNYVDRLNESQIRELCEIYTYNFTDLVYEVNDGYIDISLRNSEGCEDNYVFRDFDVDIIDWMTSDEFRYLKLYREKMLEWFGNQYAVDFLYYRF